MAKPKKIKDAIRLSVVLSKMQADRIQKLAIKMSVDEERTITVSEVIRMAIETFRPSKQLDFLNNTKSV